jgi:hypothetical protein
MARPTVSAQFLSPEWVGGIRQHGMIINGGRNKKTTINITTKENKMKHFQKKIFSLKQVSGLLTAVFVGISALAYGVTLPFPSFTAGTVISASEVNSNFAALKGAVDTLEAQATTTVKTKKLSGTTGIGEGFSVNIPHGLDASKILSINVMVEWTTNSYIHPRYDVAGYEFRWFSTNTEIIVTNLVGNSSSILAKPIKILITYEG